MNRHQRTYLEEVIRETLRKGGPPGTVVRMSDYSSEPVGDQANQVLVRTWRDRGFPTWVLTDEVAEHLCTLGEQYMQTLTSEEIATYRSRPHFFVVYWLHNETGGFLLGQASGETQWALQTYVVFDDYTHPVAQENNEVKFVQLLHGIHYATQSSAKTTQLAQWLDGRQRNALKHRADYTTREFVLQPIRDWAQRTRREKETKAQEEAERVEHEEAEKRRLALLVHVPEHHVGPKRPHTRKLKSGRIIQVKESRPHIRHAHTKGPKDGPLSISLKQIKPSEKKPNEST